MEAAPVAEKKPHLLRPEQIEDSDQDNVREHALLTQLLRVLKRLDCPTCANTSKWRILCVYAAYNSRCPLVVPVPKTCKAVLTLRF